MQILIKTPFSSRSKGNYSSYIRASRRPRRINARASSAGSESPNKEQVEARIRKAVNLVQTSDKLILSDVGGNKGLIVWQAIRDIPPKYRPELVDRLSASDIRQLWKLAGQRYAASKSQIVTSIGLDYSIWRDLPADYTEIVYHTGKAALPLPNLLGRFQKAYFLPPNLASTGDIEENDTVYGRVIHNSALRNRVYPGPLYLKCTVGTATIPVLNDLCDMKIEYINPDELPFTSDDIPKSAWPRPREPPFPFNKGYTDYIRAAGPGVFVGVGFRTEEMDKGLWPNLYFVMANANTESLT